MKKNNWQLLSFKLVLTILGIGLICVALMLFLNYREKESIKTEQKKQEVYVLSLAKLKEYPKDSSWQNIGINHTKLYTKYENGNLYYRVGFMLNKVNSIPEHFGKGDGFTIKLRDTAGFEITSIFLSFNFEPPTIYVGEDRKRTGFVFEGDKRMHQSDYEKISYFDVDLNF